jgi:hypothetical protein
VDIACIALVKEKIVLVPVAAISRSDSGHGQYVVVT